MFVIDSNIAIAALNGDPTVQGHFAEVRTSDIGSPAVVVAELLYGAYRSRRVESNLRRVAALRARIQTLWMTDAVLVAYASKRADLRGRGIAKNDFDLQIASTALALGATLVTDDRALLDGSIAGLEAENWLAA
jgi:tRNA(fMet)-specific endonuclease VapC